MEKSNVKEGVWYLVNPVYLSTKRIAIAKYSDVENEKVEYLIHRSGLVEEGLLMTTLALLEKADKTDIIWLKNEVESRK